MNSPFKFPRRVRIHGGECGAVARALHHEAQKDALMSYEQTLVTTEKAVLSQADSGKALGSTFNERKQMSTKTTLKRIALVAVSALGFGVLSTVSANSATVTPTATSSFSLNTTSITNIVGSTVGGSAYGVFEVSLTSNKGIASPLFSGETLTATVIANPNPDAVTSSTNNTMVTAEWATAYNPATGAVSTVDDGTFTSAEDGEGTGYFDLGLATAKRGGELTAANDYVYNDDTSKSTATYALKVHVNSANAIGDGFFTIRIALLDGNGNAIQVSNVRFQAVAEKVDAGGTLTLTATGSQLRGGALLNSTLQNIQATLRDTNGGLIRDGANLAPSLSGTLTDTATSPDVDTMTFADTGDDPQADSVALDGNYVAAVADISNRAGTSTARVSFGTASPATASVVITAAGGANFGNTTISATGQVATGANWNVPLTTKSATATFTLYADANTALAAATRVGNTAVWYTLDHSAGCVLGDMTPVRVTTPTRVLTDANGQVSIAIANKNPIGGCTTTVTFSGPGVVSNPTSGALSRSISWVEPAATTVVKSPAGNYSAVLKSTHKVTWTITDQFGSPIVGSTVTFSHTGANAPASTTTAPSAISDANGQVSYTWTDAAGVVGSSTLGSDKVSLLKIGTADAPASTDVTVTYVATMPAIASLYSTYTTTDTSGTTLTGLVPATNIGGTGGVLTSNADAIDSTKVVTGTAAAPWVRLNFEARIAGGTSGTNGVPTTVTVSGAKVIGNDGKLGSSVIVYANENVFVLGTSAGVATVTATNGTITSTATINFTNAAGDARVLALTEAAGLVTAKVTDAFGSAVGGVTVDVVGTGGAWFGNGSTSASFQTASNGEVTFQVTGAGTVTASLSRTTYPKTLNLAGAGNATGTVVTPGAPAGVRTASVTTSGIVDAAKVAADAATAAAKAAQDAAVAAAAKAAADAVAAAKAAEAASVAASKAAQDAAVAQAKAAQDAADAATDAANEAIDAANAATDAANLAAEAADAATVAAEEARDAADASTAAVEELATQVATLMAALKAQITTLANTVAKIAKKVKA